MNTAPQIPPLLPWRELQNTLASSFTARARGLFANSFVIRKGDSPVGCLSFNGLSGAEFAAGALKSTIRRNPNGGYEMFSGNDRILTAVQPTAALDALEITCGDSFYPARISFLRNEARVFSAEGKESMLLLGDMIGRRYEITVDRADPAALPGAILLLYHTATFRRRAYVT